MKKYLDYAGQTYKVQLHYRLGGINYFTGSCDPRGIYFSIAPVSISRSANGEVTMESQTAFSGSTRLVKPLNRKNNKLLELLSQKLDNNLCTSLVQSFASKQLTAEQIDSIFVSS